MTTSKPADVEKPLWVHLDDLRKLLFRCLGVVAVCVVCCFWQKELLFAVILAPCHSDFVGYRLLSGLNPFGNELHNLFSVNFALINTSLSGQFYVHFESAFMSGLALAIPYCLWQIVKYVMPALYDNERRFALVVVSLCYLMFALGFLLSYFLLFPVALHFLGNYQVSEIVQNQITITSYIDNFIVLSISLGVAFELPFVVWLLHKLNFLSLTQLCQYRKYVLVLLLFMAAIITPPDIFTMLLVTAPLYLLYECSIVVLKIF